MKKMTKVLSLLLCLVMVLGMFPATSLAADGETNIFMNVSATEVNVGDTLTVTIGHGDMYVSSFAFGFDFDNTLLEVTKVSVKTLEFYDEENEEDSVATATAKSTKAEANASGHVGVAFARGVETECYAKDVILQVTFTAIAAGTVEFVMFEDSSGTDGYKGENIESATVTVVDPNASTEITATIVFDDTAKRTEFSTEKQVWQENGVTVTNEKGSSTSNVANYYKPARFYKNSTVTVEFPSMTKIEINCNASKYATALQSSITDGTVTVDGNVVTIVFAEAVDSYSIVLSGGQVRVDSMTIYAVTSGEGGETPTECTHENVTHVEAVAATCQVKGNIEYWCCADCGKYFSDAECTTEITLAETELALAEHDYNNPEDARRCVNCGYYKPDSTLTIEEAIAWGVTFAHNTYTTDKYYVIGTVSDVYQTYYGNMHITDESGNIFTIYGTYNADGSVRYGDMEEKPVAGDTVKIYGIIGQFKDNAQIKNGWIIEFTHEHKAYGFEHDDNNHWQVCACGEIMEGTTEAHDFTYSFEYVPGVFENTHTIHYYCECGAMQFGETEDCADEKNNETQEAGADGNCDYCGEHVCVMTLIPGKAATCTEDGWKDYYHCDSCDKYYYEDHEQYWEIGDLEEWKTSDDGKIPAGHTSEEVTYQNITATTHDVHYACCGALKEAGVSHDFANADYKCECGKVQEFLLTVYYLVVNETTGMSEWKSVEFYVPYGANVMDAIHTMVDDLLPDGTILHYVDEYNNGEATLAGFHRIDKDSTMPARELYAEQSFYYYGWTIYDGFESYVDTHGYLEGWNYIEEDFDDVAGGAWYYFAYVEAVGLHCRVEGLTRVEYPEMTINGITYEANKDALSYDANFIDATEAWFLFDENGKFQTTFTGVLDGHYYANGMQAWHPGAVEGMYFIGDLVNGGNIPANGDTYIIYANGTELVEGAIYNFTNGVLSGFEGVVEGKYYEGSRLMIGAGLVAYEDGYIYVRSTGEIVVNAEYYVPVNDLGIASGLYKFDENGFLVEPQFSDVNGVVDGYYYENGKIVYGAGLIEWEGNYYYVRSNGQVATGTYWITNANTEKTGYEPGKYEFDEDGKMLAVKNGIVDGYYYVNNRIQYGAGLIELDGNFYYVRSNGQVATGIYWITNANTEETGFVAGKYTFDENGKMIIE